jgi:1-aminocyclopropane-1-carboxylate deaminase/D-cysteine desulfhydrase-like pyridoxal-dependent ACC family enzyme
MTPTPDRSTLRAALSARPRLPLGTWPSPVSALPARAQDWGEGSLWLKCDGHSAPLYGGNKVRKLEYLLADAARHGARRLCTFGATGSNHCLATALHGRAAGFDVEVVLVPQAPNRVCARTFAAIQASGARVTLLSHREALPAAMAWRGLKGALGSRYVIAPGGSDGIGTLGFIAAACELADQVDAGACPAPDRIYVPLGSGGTFAGLWLGCALAGLRAEVIGVRVVDRLFCNAATAWQQAAKVARTLADAGYPRAALARALRRAPRVVHNQFGAAYGAPTPAGEAARAALVADGGPDLEPTYTAKTFASLRADAAAGLLRDQVVMFWNTYNLQPISGEQCMINHL